MNNSKSFKTAIRHNNPVASDHYKAIYTNNPVGSWPDKNPFGYAPSLKNNPSNEDFVFTSSIRNGMSIRNCFLGVSATRLVNPKHIKTKAVRGWH